MRTIRLRTASTERVPAGRTAGATAAMVACAPASQGATASDVTASDASAPSDATQNGRCCLPVTTTLPSLFIPPETSSHGAREDANTGK